MSFRFGVTILFLAIIPTSIALSGQVHAFNVEDDIGMIRFSNPQPQVGVPGSEAAEMSPDGKYIAVVTTRGLLASDQIESQIVLFAVDEVKSALNNPNQPMPKPRVVATVDSFPHRQQPEAYVPVINDLRWSSDARTLYFRRENAQGFSQLCAADVQRMRLEILTPSTENVNLFAVSSDTVVYTSSRAGDRFETASDRIINRDARVATGLPIFAVLAPDNLIQSAPERWSLVVLRREDGHWKSMKVPGFDLLDRSYFANLTPFALSPNRKSVVTLLPVSAIPSAWERYQPSAGAEHMHFKSGDEDALDPRNLNRPQRYVRIDFQTGQQTTLIDAPDGRSLGYVQPRRAIWSPDGRRILLTNTFLPLEAGSAAIGDRDRACLVASVELKRREAHCLLFSPGDESPNSLRSVEFGRDADEVTVVQKTASDQQRRSTYEFRVDQWFLVESKYETLIPVTPAEGHSIGTKGMQAVRVFVQQDLNDPPTLWAEESSLGRKRQVWDPNPQFSRVRFADAMAYHWTDGAGDEWDGQLVKPLDYVPGKKYPLVIQLYAIDRGQFITSGPYPTAFAARELASVGFFVLLVQKKPDTLTEQDPIRHLRAYRSAVEKLAAKGMIDRTRVGVIGFSWSCWYAVDALVRDPDLFAAATVADGLDDSYMQYLLAADAQPIRRQMEHIRGSGPFGSGLQTWLADAPGFHLDRVRAPVRIEAISPMGVLSEWELYASLRMQNKPVDLIYFPSGTHAHQKPLERLESQQGDVDWFRFWLQGYEDPDPGKKAQYKRWEHLRELKDAENKAESQPTGPKPN